MKQPETVIFWGAGATAELGIRTTAQQAGFIERLTGAHSDSRRSIKKRVAKALGPDRAPRWHSALKDLITILGDDNENYDRIDSISPAQLTAMQRNWRPGAKNEELKNRIIHLRLIYDWPALKSLVSICPKAPGDAFPLNDLFNLLDLHIPLNFGVRALTRNGARPRRSPDVEFFDSRRLIGAKNALRMLLIAAFYIDWQECIRLKGRTLNQYHGFAELFARGMQRKGRELAKTHRLDQPAFYQGDVGFVSLNYDPIALWLQFMVNKELNNSPSVPRVGSPPRPMHLFQDFGHLIPARRIAKTELDWPWYPMNEAATQRLNEEAEADCPRIRLTKFLFPHGSLCWRECPDCRKLSAYHGDEWNLASPGLFPPPPLRAFDTAPCPPSIPSHERKEREKGAIDARACLHCGTLTFAHHAQTVMQSSFKAPPPSFIEEIQRELRATTMHAGHIVLMGYSLPQDDVSYRSLFAAARQRDKTHPVRCTVVGKNKRRVGWHGPARLACLVSKQATVAAAVDIFGEKNVRFYGGGIPEVFLYRGRATEKKLEQLLAWSPTP